MPKPKSWRINTDKKCHLISGTQPQFLFGFPVWSYPLWARRFFRLWTGCFGFGFYSFSLGSLLLGLGILVVSGLATRSVLSTCFGAGDFRFNCKLAPLYSPNNWLIKIPHFQFKLKSKRKNPNVESWRGSFRWFLPLPLVANSARLAAASWIFAYGTTTFFLGFSVGVLTSKEQFFDRGGGVIISSPSSGTYYRSKWKHT